MSAGGTNLGTNKGLVELHNLGFHVERLQPDGLLARKGFPPQCISGNYDQWQLRSNILCASSRSSLRLTSQQRDVAIHVLSGMAVALDPKCILHGEPETRMTPASPRHEVCAALSSFFISKSMRAGASGRFTWDKMSHDQDHGVSEPLVPWPGLPAQQRSGNGCGVTVKRGSLLEPLGPEREAEPATVGSLVG